MQLDLVRMLPGLARLGIFIFLVVAWPVLVAAVGPRLVRRVAPAVRRAGGVAALVVFDLGLFTTLSFRGQWADALAVAAACAAFWLWVAGAPAALRWSVLLVWFTVLVAQASDVVPFHWQSSREGAVEPPIRVDALPCGRVAELRTYGGAVASTRTQVTVLSRPLGGLLEHELGFSDFDEDRYHPDELHFEPASSGGCGAVLRHRGQEIWRVG